MELALRVADFLVTRRRARRSPATLALYRRQLEAWLADRATHHRSPEIASIDLAELLDYFGRLADTPTRGKLRQASTCASVYRTIRAFWRWAAKEGSLTPEQATYFDRLSAPHVPRKIRQSTDRDQLQKLLAACGDPSAGGVDGETAARNRALLWLLFESGARIAEVCNLTDSQVDLVKRRARITGKGEKQRPIFWGPSTAAALAQYMLVRRGSRGGELPLFRGTSIRNSGGAMTTDAIRAAIKRLAAEAGVTLPHGAPLHAFRHGWARRAIRNGADISDVSTLMGHSSIQTTMIYLQGDEDQMQDIDKIGTFHYQAS